MERWLECLETVSNSVRVADEAICTSMHQFLTCTGEHTLMTPILEKLNSLICRIGNSSTELVNCLTDLSMMSSALNSTVDVNPEEVHTLMLNLFNIFLKQLVVHQKESYEALEQTELLFSRRKYLFTNSVDSNECTVSIPTEPINSSPLVSIVSVAATGIVESKEDKKAKGDFDAEMDFFPGSQELQQQLKTDKAKLLTENSLVNNNIYYAKAKERTQEIYFDPLATVSLEENVVDMNDPEYLRVHSTVEEALGRLVISSRPSVFTAPEVIEQQKPVATYYISLSPPGCLGPLLFINYISLREDIQTDLMCDILQAECVEVMPFESHAGEIVAENVAELSGLPACGWRTGVSEDRQQTLYTSYVLVDHDVKLQKYLMIQESLIFNGEREEVLLIITPLQNAEQFAKVSVWVFGAETCPRVSLSSKKNRSTRAMAIVDITKSVYEQNGFKEVRQEVVNAVVEHRRPQVVENELFSLSQAAATFQGTVELASLDEPDDDRSWGIGDVAKEAVRGATAVVMAPVSVGRVVGNAVLDASGMTNVIKQQVEGLFRKSFPHLATEEITDSFSCVLKVDGASVPRQGFLFVTPHWLCFQNSLGATNFSLEWDEVKDVERHRSVRVLENAISITTHTGDSYFLISFVQREQAYSAIMKQWLRR